MKTTILIQSIQITVTCTMMVTVFLFTRIIVNNVKTMYSLQPAGSGMTAFFDMIQ